MPDPDFGAYVETRVTLLMLRPKPPPSPQQLQQPDRQVAHHAKGVPKRHLGFATPDDLDQSRFAPVVWKA